MNYQNTISGSINKGKNLVNGTFKSAENPCAVAYVFGFNGQEKDDEITGNTGSLYTAEFWEYDSRIGRRWNVDPITYPWQSPYACFNNNPIYFVDPLGLEPDDPPASTLSPGGNNSPNEGRFDFKNMGGNSSNTSVSSWGPPKGGYTYITPSLDFLKTSNTQATLPNSPLLRNTQGGGNAPKGNLNGGGKGIEEAQGGGGQYPIDNPYISSDYGMRNGERHNGLDFVNQQKGAVNGKRVYSVTDGKIVRLITTPDGNRAGVRVRIQAPSGYQYNYFHLQDGSNSHLQYNMPINKGDFIGNVGNTGGSRGAHLHFEIWAPNGTKANPYDIYPALHNIPHR